VIFKCSPLFISIVLSLALVACTDSGTSSGDGNGPSSSKCTNTYGVNTVTDCRDGQTYKTVVISTQTWMAENLNYDTLDGTGSWCYNSSSSYCDTYGRLYNWTTAMGISLAYNSSALGDSVNHRGICLEGWHIPSDTEWKKLISDVVGLNIAGTTLIGVSSTVGTNLKASSGWENYSGISNLDNYSFSAMPGGLYEDGTFSNIGLYGFWWTSSEYSTTHTNLRYMGYDITAVVSARAPKTEGISMRCIKD